MSFSNVYIEVTTNEDVLCQDNLSQKSSTKILSVAHVVHLTASCMHCVQILTIFPFPVSIIALDIDVGEATAETLTF